MIVFPMAGESRRFLAAGFEQPKYMLPLDGRPLFDWTVLSMRRLFDRTDFLFVARDIQGTGMFLQKRLAAMGLRAAKVCLLDASTAGQAETVELGLKNAGVARQEPILIFNIDTIRPGFDMEEVPEEDGWLETFEAPGTGWSFVELDPKDTARVIRCAEKQRISEHCCTGIYYFKEAGLFLSALAAEREAPSSHELFVAPLYNHLIAEGRRIGWRAVPSGKVILSGVPAEYESLKDRTLSAVEW
jgi:hypothetical protein